MEKFTVHEGLAVPLDRGNVDTDAIVPKQFLKSIRRAGFGVNLFDAWRYLDIGEPDQDCSKRPLNPDFVLNQARYHGASVLLARENFGCGSSREHAPWALADYGFRVIIAPSFAEIFYNNCFKNGLLPIVLAEQEVDDLFKACDSTPGFQLAIDLPAQTVAWPGKQRVSSFEVDRSRKHRLLHGLDDIALTISHSDKIRAYETWRKQEEDWVF
ncbi:MAG: 3-isopropylmalate dehydratase small subunit [Massilia sp.]|nr:3-isopropylmalate dehydratase small subunit [Massilia sp.]MDB5792546.1 3-isopropylmalate dehydratase small subunit [Massilia sp.]